MRAGRVFPAFRVPLVMAAILIGVVTFGAGIAGATSTYAVVNGQGSTLAALAFQTWTQGAEIKDGLDVNYTATGSPGGLSAYAAGTDTFAGSEAEFSELYPTTPGYLSKIPRGFAYVPDLGSAVALMYHVALKPTGSGPVTDLRLSPLTVARIFMGDITYWTSPTITADNGGLVLPHKSITLDLRSGESGTTALFYDWIKHTDPTQYTAWATANDFSKTSRIWEVDDGTAGFGDGPGFADYGGSDQQAQAIASGTGLWSIGYDEFSYAFVYHDEVASVENAAGNWAQPTVKSIDDALHSAVLAPDTSETLAGVYDSTTPLAYPMSFYSYLIYQCEASPTRPTCQGGYTNPAATNTMAAFMRYVACTGQEKMATIGYAPLPANLSQQMADAIGYMTGEPPERLDASNCANPQFAGWQTTVTPSVTPVASVAGQPVTFGAMVSAGAGVPTGTVTFSTGATTLCRAQLSSGLASCQASDAAVGTDVVTAAYGGGPTFTPSDGGTTLAVVPAPLTAPPGSTTSASATSTASTGTASAAVTGLSASATGLGSLTVATYGGGNPTVSAVSGGTGVFTDVAVAPGSTFRSLALTFCDLGGGNSVSWWNGTTWVSFSDQTYSSASECVDATVDGSTSPTLAQLSGTPVAAVNTAPPSNGSLAGPVVGMASLPDGSGYWLVNAAGAVSAHGDAVDYGSMAGQPLNAPITHIVSTADGHGYWLVAADGGTFAFGDAGFYGSMGGQHLNAPVVDIAPTADGQGYWLVASDGGIFAFGDAPFRGSMGGQPLNRPVVAVSADDATGGYWEVASDGGIFAFGAPFFGSTAGTALNQPVNGMAGTADGRGYWLVASDGGIFAFGDAHFGGSTGSMALNSPIVSMAPDDTSGGYWLTGSDGGIFAFGAPFFGAD